MIRKDVVAGLGEIGLPILKLISKKEIIVGYDLDKNLMNPKKNKKLKNNPTRFLHVAIPVTKKFNSNIISLYEKFSIKNFFSYLNCFIIRFLKEFYF